MAESEAVQIALTALEESKKALAAGLYNSAVEEADRAVETLASRYLPGIEVSTLLLVTLTLLSLIACRCPPRSRGWGSWGASSGSGSPPRWTGSAGS
jgi:hypothetical protein